MSLIDFQRALGRSVRAANRAGDAPLGELDLAPSDRDRLSRVLESPGFRFTASIQRSWCEGRAAKGAKLTLSMVSAEDRRRLIGDWVDSGGGTNSFFDAEADAFLDFLAGRLPNPSHASTICRLERGILRAAEIVASFASPDARHRDDPTGLLRAGSHAALIAFFTEPDRLLAALRGETALPPLSTTISPVLVAPGLPSLARPAEPAEAALWQSLQEPKTVAALRRDGHAGGTIENFMTVGAAEPA